MAGLATALRVVVDAAWLTTWVNGAELLAVKLLSPLYRAVIVCDPRSSAAVRVLALPLASTGTVSRTTLPSRNVTSPVGALETWVLGVTVAVNVTNWLKTEGLSDDTRVIVVPRVERVKTTLCPLAPPA